MTKAREAWLKTSRQQYMTRKRKRKLQRRYR